MMAQISPRDRKLPPGCVEGKHGYLSQECHSIWKYEPSFEVALIFAALFGMATLLHILQAIRYKKAYCSVIIMGSLWETAGYLFRAANTRDQQNTSLYMIWLAFNSLAPIWINAFVYMILGRLVWTFLSAQRIMKIRAPTLAALFVLLDIAAFLVQAFSVALMTPTASADQILLGTHIYMGGLGVQQFFMVIFLVFVIRFQAGARLAERKGEHRGRGFSRGYLSGWRGQVLTEYLALVFITVRIVFRLCEYSNGNNPTVLQTVEVYFYALDGVPMFIAVVLFNIVHPGRIMPKTKMPSFWSTCLGCCRSKKKDHKLTSMSDESQESLRLQHQAVEGYMYRNQPLQTVDTRYWGR
ncbi:RTA1 like protein-domain-containing protein [Xylariomycetidae sp. FL2044]|nr:RTA1 like protein-domain-containing protein [Xylariomycetidae sp. FL2044]